jgi:hypothetical protein
VYLCVYIIIPVTRISMFTKKKNIESIFSLDPYIYIYVKKLSFHPLHGKIKFLLLRAILYFFNDLLIITILLKGIFIFS